MCEQQHAAPARPRRGGLSARSCLGALIIFMFVAAASADAGSAAIAGGTAMQWLPVGGRIEAFSVVGPDGERRIVAPSGTIIVFWATWSPSSLALLSDILPLARSMTMHWSVIPINVDPISPPSAAADSAAALLRAETGYQDTAWFDPARELLDRWGVVAVPTILIGDVAGRVVAAGRGWSEPVREHVHGMLLVGDSAPAQSAPDIDIQRCGGRLAQTAKLWHSGHSAAVARELPRIGRECRGLSTPSVYTALWCWEAGDTAGARRAVEKAVATDSTDPWASAAVAAMHFYRQRDSLALEWAGRAVAADSTFTPAWGLLARAALALGREQEARDALDVIGSLNRGDPAYDGIAAMLSESPQARDSTLIQWRRELKRRLY